MTEKTTEEKINDLHDFCIRMEPFIKKVEKIDNAVFNEGWGIASQVKIMWAIYCIIVGALVKKWMSE